MKQLIRLTTAQANKVRGIYKPNHRCEPVKVEAGFYILHAGMVLDVPELNGKWPVISKLNVFTIGDKSVSDLKYKAFLKRYEALEDGPPK